MDQGFALSAGSAPHLFWGGLARAELPHHQSTGDQESPQNQILLTPLTEWTACFGAFKIMNNRIPHQNIII